MATVSIVSRPIVTIDNGSPVIKSRWVAGWNPIIYEFEFTGVGDTTSYMLLSVYEFGSNTLLAQDNYSPRNGRIKIDISSKVQGYLYNRYEPDFTNGINCKDLGNTRAVYITYQLNTATTQGSVITDESNYIFVTSSVKQIGETYGQNMGEYVPYGIEGVIKAKFLTKFEEPVLFDGYPFTLSFIYSELIIGHDLKAIEDKKDINRTHQAFDETDLDTSQGYFVNHLQLGDYASNVHYVGVSISTGQPNNDNYVYEGYVDDGYTEAR